MGQTTPMITIPSPVRKLLSASLREEGSVSRKKTTFPSTGSTSLVFYLIDNDTKKRGNLARLTRELGYEAVEFDSIERFFHLIHTEPFGVIVSEFNFETLEGTDLMKILREKEWRVPVIFAAGVPSYTDCVNAIQAGALSYFEKPEGNSSDFSRRAQKAAEAAVNRQTELKHLAQLEEQLHNLTSKEREVLDLLFAGNSMKTIASNFGTSFQAVARHRQRILEKLSLEGDVALVRWVVQFNALRRNMVVD